MQIESAIKETDEHALIQAIKTAELAASAWANCFGHRQRQETLKLIQSERETLDSISEAISADIPEELPEGLTGNWQRPT